MVSFSEWLGIKEADLPTNVTTQGRTANFQLPGEAKWRGGNANAAWRGGVQPVTNTTRIANFEKMVQTLGLHDPTIQQFYQTHAKDPEMMKGMMNIVRKYRERADARGM